MSERLTGVIERINGSLILGKFKEEPKMGDLIEVGNLKLMGEIVRLSQDIAYIQCYESTSGIKPGEPVVDIGTPLVAELGPGLMAQIVDGISRSETKLWDLTGPFITRGTNIAPLDREKKWNFEPLVKPGDEVSGGDFIGQVQETESFVHKIMVPPNQTGVIKSIDEGEFTVTDTIGVLTTENGDVDLKMMQTWPVRVGRPIKERLALSQPLITGQRVIDTFFPCAKGGASAVPGGFGTGKTVTLQQIAKWSDADIIVYIGCGERGNEMADSTSRWAEALRDISGRLEEIPAEAGFPAYLADRIASIYERSGRVKVPATEDRYGSLTLLGAVSPPGGDYSEPVTTTTLRFIGTFWALDSQLAYRRHFPAINWLRSFSRYLDVAARWWSELDPTWEETRSQALRILEEAAEIEETARIIGEKALPDDQRLVLLLAEMLREGFLVQSAFHEVDRYCPPEKQVKLLRLFTDFYNTVRPLIEQGVPIDQVRELDAIRDIMRLKEYEGEEPIDNARAQMMSEIDALADQYEVESA